MPPHKSFTATLALAMLAVPGVALAAPAQVAHVVKDWYIATTGDDSHDCSSGSPCLTVGHAANFATSGDVVHVAAGTYNESVGVASYKSLTFIGVGPGTATDSSGASTIKGVGGGTALALTGGGSVTGLRLVGDQNVASAGYGLELSGDDGNPKSYTVSNVIAFGGTNTSNVGTIAIWITGQNGSQVTADLHDVFAKSRGTSGATSPAVQVQDTSPGHTVATLTRDTITAGTNGRGIEQDGGGAVNLIDSTVLAATGSSGITGDGPLTVTRSAVHGTEEGIVMTNTATLVLTDSLVTAAPASGNREAVDLDNLAAGARTTTITGSTLVTTSSGGSDQALTVQAQTGVTQTVNLVNSVLHVAKPDGTPAANSFDIKAFNNSGALTVTASHSSFTTVGTATGAVLPAPGSGTNITGDPGFTSWTGADYSLLPTSPLIDKGDPTVVTAGEQDIAQHARSVDGNGDCTSLPDIGAYELQGHAGVPPVATVSGPALVSKKPATFTATPASGYTLSWLFSDGATASGPSVTHTFTKSGPGSATVTATLLGCVATANRTFTVDATPPTVTKLKLAGKKITLTVSEKSTTLLTVERVSNGRMVNKKCVVATAHNSHAKACKRYTKVTGSLSKPATKKGALTVAWTGKLHGHTLPPGTYRLDAIATDVAGNPSKTATFTFTIKPRS